MNESDDKRFGAESTLGSGGVAGDDEADGERRTASCGFEIDGPQIFVRVLLRAREKRWSAVGGDEAPDGGMAGRGGFAAQGVHVIVRQIVGGCVLGSGCEEKEIAEVGDALMVAVHGLQAVAHEICARLDGLIAKIFYSHVEMNRADDFTVDELAIIDAQRRVPGGCVGGGASVHPDFELGAAAR